MDEHIRDETSRKRPSRHDYAHSALSRRGVLLGGGGVAAAVALGTGVSHIWQPRWREPLRMAMASRW